MELLLSSLNSLCADCLTSSCSHSNTAEKTQDIACQTLLQNEQSLFTKILSDAREDNLSGSQKQLLPELTRLVLQTRVKQDGFMRGSNHMHVLLVLSFIRMALKEGAVIDSCVEGIDQDFVVKLVRLCETYWELYVDSAFHSQKMFDKLLVELVLILSRIVSTPKLTNQSRLLVTSHCTDTTVAAAEDDTVRGIVCICTSLLPSGNPNLISCALLLLSNLLMMQDDEDEKTNIGKSVSVEGISSRAVICGKMLNGDVVSEVLDLLSQNVQVAVGGGPGTGGRGTPSCRETVENSCGKVLLALSECDATREKMGREVILRDGIVILLNKILASSNSDGHYNSDYLVWCCCWTLAKLALSSCCQQISSCILSQQALPHLLSFVSQPEKVTTTQESSSEEEQERLEMNMDWQNRETNNVECLKRVTSSKVAVCQVFARICFVESSCRLFVESNGIYLMGRVLFTCQISPYEEVNEETKKLLASAVMVLRLMFSREFNRKVIWSFLPGVLCEEFVKCGNYNLIFSQYLPLANKLFLFCKDSNHAKDDLENKLESLNLSNRKDFKRIGQYKVLDALGDGSFGSVFKVVREGRDSVHALKKISFGPTTGAQQSVGKRKALANTITNEVNILKEKLNHPNLVKYLKTFHEEGNLYVVMEYVDGVSLYQHLNFIQESKSGPIQEEWIWNFAIQLIQGLRYLHVERNLIHRDLSPNNILITFDDVVKITDFGFTRQGNESGVCTSVVGTVVYWCPEITQQKPYDCKADIWAYGCILYQTCTLKPPFEAENILLLAKKIVERKFVAIDSNLSYSKLMRDIIYSCITVEAQDRPDSIGIIGMMGEKLLQQIDVQSEKLKQYRRKISQITAKYEGSQRLKHWSNLGSLQFTSASPTRETSTPPPDLSKKSGSSTSLNSDLAVSPLAGSGSFVPRLCFSAGSKRSVLNRATLVVPVSKLKEIPRVGDPFVESMELLRNIEQVLSTRYTTSDHQAEKSLTLVMKRRLFEAGDSTWMKSEIHKLVSRSSDFIDFTSSSTSGVMHFERSYDQLISLCLRNLNASSSGNHAKVSEASRNSDGAGDSATFNSGVGTSMTYGEFMRILDSLSYNS